jgi:tetratricopeptide (TPR) repeat protein
LRGRNYAQRYELEAATEALETAIDLDPTNVDALVELARVNNILMFSGMGLPKDLMPVARGYNERALALNPDHRHGRAHGALIRLFDDGEYQKAIDQFAELLDEYPNDTDVLRYYSYALEVIGRPDLAMRLLTRMIEIDPFDPSGYGERGRIYSGMGQYEEAVADFGHGESISHCCDFDLAFIALEQGDTEGIRRRLQHIEEWGGANSPWYPLVSAFLAFLEGDSQKGVDLLTSLVDEGSVTPWFVKRFAAQALQGTERALECYSNALTGREPGALMNVRGSVALRANNPEFYSHPRYEKMLRDVGLDAASIADFRVPTFPF